MLLIYTVDEQHETTITIQLAIHYELYQNLYKSYHPLLICITTKFNLLVDWKYRSVSVRLVPRTEYSAVPL